MKYYLIMATLLCILHTPVASMHKKQLLLSQEDEAKIAALLEDEELMHEPVISKVANIDKIISPAPLAHLTLAEQQLLFHNRLLVNTARQQAIVRGSILSNDQDLNSTAKELLAVTVKAPEAARRSSFVCQAHDCSYILYPLHIAISHGLIKSATSLILAGANPNAKDHLGRRPVHLIARVKDKAEQLALANLLKSYRADFDAPDRSGEVALHYAVQEEAYELLDFLLECDANPNCNVEADEAGTNSVLSAGTSPLWRAISIGRIPAVGLLLRKKARIKKAEGVAAQLLYHTTSDENQKKLLIKILATICYH